MEEQNPKTEEKVPMTKEEKSRAFRADMYDWMQCIVSALLTCVLAFVFVGRVIGVIGSSMEPTLYWGDKLVISNLFYTPEQGDIVVLRKENFKSDPIVKRVIALGGQTVDIDFEKGIVYVDGVALEEDYIKEWMYVPSYGDVINNVTVPEGCIFVMGDNRNESADSRYPAIGIVDERCVIGRAVMVLFPFGNFGVL